jgi:5'-nucleotidase
MQQGEYPTLATTQRQSDGRTVCIVHAWDYAHLLGHLEVGFDDSGNVLSCGGSPIVPFEVNAAAADSDIVKSYLEDLGPAFVQIEEDATAKAALQVYLDELESRLGVVIATVPEAICYERIPGQGRSTICTAESTSEMGGAACNLVAQAFLDQTASAGVSIQNGGGCRTDITAGNFTLEDAITLLPFSNTIVTLELTGAQIKMVLEEALENAFNGGSTGAYPYAAGLRYAVDANKEMGNRISSLEINLRLAEASWNAIDADMLYTVATNDFIAGGQDGYATFGKVADELLSPRTLNTLVNPPLDSFSTQSFVPLTIVDETGDETKVDDTDSSAGKLLISFYGITTTLVAALVL